MGKRIDPSALDSSPAASQALKAPQSGASRMERADRAAVSLEQAVPEEREIAAA